MRSPRVLLVEDDASLRRFVGMALDELAIELIECDSVASAVQVLEHSPVELILTDLMMPGESGFGLLQRLQASPALQGRAKVIVFSAGLDENVRRQLELYRPWRLLDKPVSVTHLEACVNEALLEMDSTGFGKANAQGIDDKVERGTVPVAGIAQAQAIEDYFEGDKVLFGAYNEACLAQFPMDLQEGDQACQSGDLSTLQRVAHSLKTVLLTLGYPALSVLARDIEKQSAEGDASVARQGWSALVTQLQAIIKG